MEQQKNDEVKQLKSVYDGKPLIVLADIGGAFVLSLLSDVLFFLSLKLGLGIAFIVISVVLIVNAVACVMLFRRRHFIAAIVILCLLTPALLLLLVFGACAWMLGGLA